MSTIVGVETDGVVALAADRANVTDGTATGSVDRLFEFDDAAAAAVGDPGSVASFGRRLGAELDRERLEGDREVAVDRLARLAAAVAEEEGVDALVAAGDDEGEPRLRTVDSHGAVLDDTAAAFGSGAQVALGMLEDETFDGESPDAEARLREILRSVAERDAETGDELDSWSRADRA